MIEITQNMYFIINTTLFVSLYSIIFIALRYTLSFYGYYPYRIYAPFIIY